jgi:hypothetical protein
MFPPLPPPIATTLAASCQPDDYQVIVTSPTGITDQGINKQTPCYLLVDDSEYMLVDEGYVEGETLVPVVRGFNGTLAIAHLAGAVVQISDRINAFGGPPYFLPPEAPLPVDQ